MAIDCGKQSVTRRHAWRTDSVIPNGINPGPPVLIPCLDNQLFRVFLILAGALALTKPQARQ
jgi:hypothetical protein